MMSLSKISIAIVKTVEEFREQVKKSIKQGTEEVV